MKVTGEMVRAAIVKTVKHDTGPYRPSAVGGPVDHYTIATSLDLNEVAEHINEQLDCIREPEK